MKKAVLLSLLVCLGVVSCTRGFTFKAFNNSGEDLVLIHHEGSVLRVISIPAGSSADVDLPTRLSIKSSNNIWEYNPVRTKMPYVYGRPFGPEVQDIQIESDGAIYLLLPRTKKAVKEFPPQPAGFPLKPR